MFKRKLNHNDENPNNTKGRKLGEDDVLLEGIHNTPANGSRLVYVYEYHSKDGWIQIGKRTLHHGEYLEVMKPTTYKGSI